jgi:hypothetical protein
MLYRLSYAHHRWKQKKYRVAQLLGALNGWAMRLARSAERKGGRFGFVAARGGIITVG